MGKTWRRDSNWNDNRERDFKSRKEKRRIEKNTHRRQFSDDETDAGFGETNFHPRDKHADYVRP